MKARLQVLAIAALALAALPVWGHRLAQDLSDEQVYGAISDLVSRASEVEMDFQQMPEGGNRATPFIWLAAVSTA